MYDKNDVSWITGASILWIFLNVTSYKNILMVWDGYGNLFHIDSLVKDMIAVSKVNSIVITKSSNPDYSYGFYPEFRSLYISNIEYNAILTRIEDIYGMSINEFSLGKLEYV